MHLNCYFTRAAVLMVTLLYNLLILDLANQFVSTPAWQHLYPPAIGNTARDSSNQAAMTLRDRSEPQIKEDSFISLPTSDTCDTETVTSVPCREFQVTHF